MQLKFQRSQRAGGVLGTTVIFCLDARADYSPAEAANIRKYKLGGQVVYNSEAAKRHLQNLDRHLSRVDSDRIQDQAAGLVRGVASLALATMKLNISIESLGRGHHIECKDLPELLDAEKVLMEACRGLKQFLDAAATFNGSIILVDFDDGEKVHTSQGALEITALPASIPSEPRESGSPSNPGAHTLGQELDYIGRQLRQSYDRNSRPFHVGAAILAAFVILCICGVHVWSVLSTLLLIGVTIAWNRMF